MNKQVSLGNIFVLLSVIILFTATCCAADAPPAMASGLIIQLASLEKNLISAEGDISIHVIGSSEIADELKKLIGTSVAKRILSKVTESGDLPTEKIDVLVVAKADMVAKAIEYTRAEKVLSVTNKPDLIKDGITLGIGINETGGQSITINMEASNQEGLDWKPVIMKIAKAVK